ncbi:MAG: peptide ABC transporter substrate-binding protein [Candidatus Saccharimonadales bacterium]
MIKRDTKLRWRRKFRRKKLQVEDIGIQAEERFEKHFVRRVGRLTDVRRFVIGWVCLIMFSIGGVALQMRQLNTDFQTTTYVDGGVYTEGVIGAFTNANPIYASGAVDNSVARLIFSGLLKYDKSNNLVGDLAESWSVNEEGNIYTVKLRPNLKWHDGEPLQADDVVFTYRTIQNPDAKSPLQASWQSIKVEAKDDLTVEFILPNVLSSFQYYLTNGIIPKSKLEMIPAAQLRSARFNTVEPIGSGPFKFDVIEVSGDKAEDRIEQIGLIPNKTYFGGVPKLQRFIIKSFRNEEALIKSFNNEELNAMSGLDNVPDTIQNLGDVVENSISLTSQVDVFFNNSEGVLADKKIRQALIQSSKVNDIIRSLGYPVVMSDSPLLKNHLGYNKEITQLKYNIEVANKLLDEAGWVKGANGIRAKDGANLSFRLFSRNTGEYTAVAQKLQEQWRALGVDVKTFLQTNDELEATITRHEYDALLYGISLGLDPDVFPYWHSSQADIRAKNRSNFSEYKSAIADKALEAGRTRSDPEIRAVKYKPFLEAWRDDSPALAIYQPRYLYVTRGKVNNFDIREMNIASNRYANVVNWQILQAKTNK